MDGYPALNMLLWHWMLQIAWGSHLLFNLTVLVDKNSYREHLHKADRWDRWSGFILWQGSWVGLKLCWRLSMEMIRLGNYFLTYMWVTESRNPHKPGSVLFFFGGNLPQRHPCTSQKPFHLAAPWNLEAVLHFKFMSYFVSGSCC